MQAQPWIGRGAHGLVLVLLSAGSQAQQAPQPAPMEAQAAGVEAPPGADPSPLRSGTAADTAQAAGTPWQGVLGLTTTYRPRYPGAPTSALRATPGFYLRYGRFTATNASGFAPRRTEDVARGLGVDLVRGDRVASSFSLGYDNGRSERSSDAYAGLGNIPHTVRARLAANIDLRGPWRLGAAWNADAMGRGNGGVGDISGGWEQHLDALSTVSVGTSLSFGDQRYMQRYYGITEAQSARSVYPVYRAKAGWRDLGVSAGWRRDLTADWVALASVSASRLLGSAASSPITRKRDGWGIGGGIGWRF